ncbi:MAG TPA: hypothetical protein VET26_01215 [Candidatus Sulfotelmatobacter sp.]|nr:hypothetical protein [Candidatus Sulfotelmatobacter sp.]
MSPAGTGALQWTSDAGPADAAADGLEAGEDGLVVAPVLGLVDADERGLWDAEGDAPPPQAASTTIAATRIRDARTA